MNDGFEPIDERLGRLGERLARQPSVVDRVMEEVHRADPVRVSGFKQGRIVKMLRSPRSAAVAAAVLLLVVFGLRPWPASRDSGAGNWWFEPPSAWAGELKAAIEGAGKTGFSCREQFFNVLPDGTRAESSTSNRFFLSGNSYRRDTFERGKLWETQWYVRSSDGLTVTGIRYVQKTYTVTHDPSAQHNAVDPMPLLNTLAERLEQSGKRLGVSRIEDRDAVEFEIASKSLDKSAADATMHIWLDQETKMPLKITHELARGPGQAIGIVLVQDHFEWNPNLPAGTFEPSIPPGFTKVQNP
jgi:outer membrane lipoprotein-sorting protein